MVVVCLHSLVQLIVVNVKKTPTFRNFFILHAFHRDDCTILHTMILHIDNVRVTNSRIYKALTTLATTVAEFGDKLSPFPTTTVSSVDRA